MSSSPQTSAKQPKVGYRSSGDDMVSFIQSPHMHAYRMDRKSAPGWYEVLEELSAKAGVRTPGLYHVPTHRINGGMAFDALVLTDGLLKMGGCSPKSQRPSKEVIGVIAHELGHRRQGMGMMLGRALPPLLLPMASMMALYIYDHTIKEHKDLSLENIGAAINKTTDDLLRQLGIRKAQPGEDEQSHAVNNEWKATLLNAGRYALAGALGFAVGLAGTRAITRHMEFDADRAAVLLTGDKHTYINFLKKGHTEGSKQFRAEIRHKERPAEITDQIRDYISTSWKNLMAETVHAHPSMAEREAYLNLTFADKVADSRAAAPHVAI